MATDILIQAGFLINLKKFHMIPNQGLVFIGDRFRTQSNIVDLPDSRKQALFKLARSFKTDHYKSARTWLALLGVMASYIPVVKWARFQMRPIQLFFLAQGSKVMSLEKKFLVPFLIQHELLWWTNRDNLSQGLHLSHPDHSHVLTTNPSDLGGGVMLNDVHMRQGHCNQHQFRWHINLKELEAVVLGLRIFQNMLNNTTVLIRTDNMATFFYIKKMGGTRLIQICRKVIDLYK